MCGLDPADIERVTEYSPDTWSNDLRVIDGVGNGRCVAFSDDTEGEILVVDLRPLDDPEVETIRQNLAGELGRPPGYTYDPDVLEGGAWGTRNTLSDRRNASATSHAFWGRTVISVYVAPLGRYRYGGDDLQNLTFQIAAIYDLER